MKTKDVANITGYSISAVRKYAVILGIAYTGEGDRKTYKWEESDVERFRSAIIAADGSRDRRGETKKKLKKLEKLEAEKLKKVEES